jgi:glycosyltransferase involved in cell wall biosynthesis
VRFGYCGRLIPEKGIDTILALANDPQLPDVEWHLHGAGDAYPATHFQGRPRVVYHGAYRSADEQARALLGLDALALFSTHNEGMPLALIEGMSAGLPWIATDRGGVRELAAPSADYVLAPQAAGVMELGGSVRALTDSILSGATSRKRQRAVYDERFAPPLVAARWLEFFNS